jgi:hypothetical protein
MRMDGAIDLFPTTLRREWSWCRLKWRAGSHSLRVSVVSPGAIPAGANLLGRRLDHASYVRAFRCTHAEVRSSASGRSDLMVRPP